MKQFVRMLVVALMVVMSVSVTQPAQAASVTAATAGTKFVGEDTNVWGKGASNRPVRVEALVNGKWSTSRTGTTSGNGSYALPLTYGSNQAGTYSYRVGVTEVSGKVSYSPTVALRRVVPVVSASAAATKFVGEGANAWGSTQMGNRPVALQVLVGSKWAQVRTGRSAANGSYVLPLSYGVTTAGTYRFRVAVTLPTGAVVVSQTVTLTRKPITVSAASAGWKGVGSATSVWGSAAGAGNRGLSLQVSVGGKWVTVNSGRTSSTGSYTVPVKYGVTTPGTYSYRVVVHSVVGAVASPAVSLLRPACPGNSAARPLVAEYFADDAQGVVNDGVACYSGNTWAWISGMRSWGVHPYMGMLRFTGSRWEAVQLGGSVGAFYEWRPGTAKYNTLPPELRSTFDAWFGR